MSARIGVGVMSALLLLYIVLVAQRAWWQREARRTGGQGMKAQGPPLPIGAAGEVFRWLHLTNTIMQTARLPEDYSEIEGDWAEMHASLKAGEYAPYHHRIKHLFKQEYALRNTNLPLPNLKRAFVEID